MSQYGNERLQKNSVRRVGECRNGGNLRVCKEVVSVSDLKISKSYATVYQ